MFAIRTMQFCSETTKKQLHGFPYSSDLTWGYHLKRLIGATSRCKLQVENRVWEQVMSFNKVAKVSELLYRGIWKNKHITTQRKTRQGSSKTHSNICIGYNCRDKSYQTTSKRNYYTILLSIYLNLWMSGF